MKNFSFLVLALSGLFAGTEHSVANPIDQKLQKIIREFELEPLTAPTSITAERIELGHFLFHTNEISGNRNISCASCHHPRAMTHDRLPVSLGEGAEGIETAQTRRLQKNGEVISRNSPALLNLNSLQYLPMFWDGRVRLFSDGRIESPEPKLISSDPELGEVAKTLSHTAAVQALFPMVDTKEMMGKSGTNEIANSPDRITAWKRIVDRLKKLPEFERRFVKAFPNSSTPHIGHVAEALSDFQRALFFASDTPYDRYLKGDLGALTLKQKRGMVVFFEKSKCGNCHRGQQLSNFQFENIASPQIGPGFDDLNDGSNEDHGRKRVSGRMNDMYKFRTPPLRNVALTAPYMHSGAFQTLEEVIEHYEDVEESLRSYRDLRAHTNYNAKLAAHSKGMNPILIGLLSPKLSRKLDFTETEEDELLVFLREALTDVRFKP